MRPSKSRIALLFAAIAAVAAATAVWAASQQTQAPVKKLRIVSAYPHDPIAFTQGLVIRDGKLYESTGLYGRSSVREVDLETGNVKRSLPLNGQIFGEGMTVLNGELFLVTWQNRIGYVFDPDTFALKRTFRYGGEGWGLTDNGKHLILSDGTAILRFLDPQNGNVVSRLAVKDGQKPVANLNELEYIDGQIFANIWYSDRIARISPSTGEVLGWIDASPLFEKVDLADPKEDVLNGIAFDRDADKLYVTGKRWPQVFEISISD